jgi:DNA-binding beta-propeller fold protein YncE
MRRILAISSLAAAVVVVGLSTSAAATAPQHLGGSAKRCKTIVKKVHGKKRHVRVCRKQKPKPKPLPSVGRIVATIHVHEFIWQLAAGEGGIWAAEDAGIAHIDPAANTVVATLATAPSQGFGPGVAAGDGSIWASNFTDNTVMRFDSGSGRLTATIPVGNAPEGIAVTPSAVWVANHHPGPDGTGSVSRIDPATNTVVATIPAGARADCCGPQGIDANAGGVWTAIPNANAVDRIDPTTNQVLAIVPAPPACGPVAAAADQVWVAGGCNGASATRIDPATNKVVARTATSTITTGVAIGFGSVWVTTTHTLERINPATNKVFERTVLGPKPPPGGDPLVVGVAVTNDAVWVNRGEDVLRIRPAG